MDSTQLERDALEGKDRDELTTIATALGGKPGSRASKAEKEAVAQRSRASTARWDGAVAERAVGDGGAVPGPAAGPGGGDEPQATESKKPLTRSEVRRGGGVLVSGLQEERRTSKSLSGKRTKARGQPPRVKSMPFAMAESETIGLGEAPTRDAVDHHSHEDGVNIESESEAATPIVCPSVALAGRVTRSEEVGRTHPEGVAESVVDVEGPPKEDLVEQGWAYSADSAVIGQPPASQEEGAGSDGRRNEPKETVQVAATADGAEGGPQVVSPA